MNWIRRRRKRKATALWAVLALLLLRVILTRTEAVAGTVLRRGPALRLATALVKSPGREVREIVRAPDPSDEAVLGRPLALALDGDRLYIADALDCAVKVFSTDGRYRGSIGRKGQGPGELTFPSGVCVSGPRIAVADKLNFRVQFFDREGKSAGGFKLPFAPDRMLALDAGRFLITSNPTGKVPGERILHVFDCAGSPLWEGLEAVTSADVVLDAFRNMVLACAGTEGDLYVVFRCGRRTILHYPASGDPAGTVEVEPSYAFRNVRTPDAGHGRLKLAGFCWAAAFDAGLLYLSPPEILDGRDLGPGRTIWSVDPETGRLRGETIELPCAVHRFLIAGDRLFAIDAEGDLRIFEVDR